MDWTLFVCPVCSAPLLRGEKAYSCANRHSYDISKEGYVNLLLPNLKKSRDPGDSKEMLDARRSFLNKGYYKPLARGIVSVIIKYRRQTLIASLQGKITFCRRRAVTGFPGGRFDNTAGLRKPGPVIRTFPAAGQDQFTGPVPDDIHTEPVQGTEFTPAAEPAEANFTILDAGCGEGYYTDYISKNRNLGKTTIYGIDISRDGIKSASKRNSSISFAVAGIYNLPVQDKSVDSLLCVFAPFHENEFHRVLKDEGVIISVTPGADHMYEFKRSLYEDAYRNDEQFMLSDRFHIRETVRIKYEMSIHGREDISNLLKMTPYYHKSPPERIESFLSGTEELKTTADFLIRILKKNIQDFNRSDTDNYGA